MLRSLPAIWSLVHTIDSFVPHAPRWHAGTGRTRRRVPVPVMLQLRPPWHCNSVHRAWAGERVAKTPGKPTCRRGAPALCRESCLLGTATRVCCRRCVAAKPTTQDVRILKHPLAFTQSFAARCNGGTHCQ